MREQMIIAMVNELAQTQQAFLTLLSQADDQNILYQHASGEDWTPAMVLAHISEARQFFANEVEKVLVTSGGEVGRTMDDPHRLQTVESRGQDSPTDLRGQLVASHNKLIKTLDNVTDEDLKLECQHVTLGLFRLEAFIQRFFIGHDRAHVQQVTDLIRGQG